MRDYEGVIFPLYTEMIERGVEEEKDVFAKYTKLSIKSGMTLYLYGSGKKRTKNIIAEGRIENVESLKAEKAWYKFGDRLFQSQIEFEEYIEGREEKELLVLELDEVQKLENPIEVPEGKNVTMAGLYVEECMIKKMDI